MSNIALDPVGLYRRIPLLPHQMMDAITKTDDVFVLVHLGVPQIDDAHWCLSIEGLVEKPLLLSLGDLKAMPQQSVQSVFQCAGNPMEPTVPTRRVANVVWGGVSLASLLAMAAPKAQARYLWSFGHDHGSFAGTRCDAYGKDLPLEQLRDYALIATELNGAPLSREHGFPARLIVPGFYGTNNVKWLSRLELCEERLDALFTTTFYDDAAPGEPSSPVRGIPVESIITAPQPGAVIEQGTEIAIKGWAWAETGVAAVEIAADDSAWMAAHVEPQTERSWQAFSARWTPSAAGSARLQVRATSLVGDAQPETGARNAIHAVEVKIVNPP